VYEPTNPIADENGYVRYPDIDLGSQMGQLIMAQRGYEANLSGVDRAKDAYEAALNIGKG
jgi:flagellar basal-body rod protein FlgC